LYSEFQRGRRAGDLRFVGYTSITDVITKERNKQMVEEQVTPDPEDEESEIDGCDIEIEDATSDEDLPDTEGGVA
jgi:hypothetical protein